MHIYIQSVDRKF